MVITFNLQVDALCSRMETQKAQKGPGEPGEISLFSSLSIGHRTLKGVQRVYAWPFPKRLFRGNCNRQDFVFVRPRGSDPALFHPSPDNVWYCRCLLIFTIVVRTDVQGSVRIKCALLSKLEPYGAPDPEADGWMTKAETCRLYELAPKPRLFVRPITAILGKAPMVRAGNTGTIPYSMRGYERAYYPGGKCDSAADKGDGSRLWYVNTWAMKWSQNE